jgi:hypothetical protein
VYASVIIPALILLLASLAVITNRVWQDTQMGPRGIAQPQRSAGNSADVYGNPDPSVVDGQSERTTLLSK